MFACQHQTSIHVFKFFTAECPVNYIFKGHQGHIRSISWLEDDTGFVTSALDASIMVWKLNPGEGQENPVWQYKLKNVDFTCVRAFKPDNDVKAEPLVYATGQDKTLREITRPGDGRKQDVSRLEQNIILNQIEIMRDRKAVFAGVGEASKPGSVQVIVYPWDKIFEI